MSGISADEPDKYNKANSTLVHDDSCFPVREAMRLINAYYAEQDPSLSLIAQLSRSAQVEAADAKYRAAVARMKSKAKKAGK